MMSNIWTGVVSELVDELFENYVTPRGREGWRICDSPNARNFFIWRKSKKLVFLRDLIYKKPLNTLIERMFFINRFFYKVGLKCDMT